MYKAELCPSAWISWPVLVRKVCVCIRLRLSFPQSEGTSKAPAKVNLHGCGGQHASLVTVYLNQGCSNSNTVGATTSSNCKELGAHIQT